MWKFRRGKGPWCVHPKNLGNSVVSLIAGLGNRDIEHVRGNYYRCRSGLWEFWYDGKLLDHEEMRPSFSLDELDEARKIIAEIS